jgi:hypothetical protein
LLTSVPERHDLKALVTTSYRLGLGRTPDAGELARGVAFLEHQSESLSTRTENPKKLDLPKPLPEGQDLALGAALVDYCHVLLNLNEFVFVD